MVSNASFNRLSDSTGDDSWSSCGASCSMYWTRPAAYATSGHRSPVTVRATCTKLLKWVLRMKRPRARAGRTPISSSVRIVEAPAAVGVGGGDPWNPGGGAEGCTTRIDVVSGPLEEVVGFGITAIPPPAVAAATGVAAAAPAAEVRRCG